MDVVSVRSAEQMAQAVGERAGEATIVAMAAAVSDYRAAETAPQKVKKTAGGEHLDLVRTPDILATLGADKKGRFLIGFAAETERLLEHARSKRAEKRVDLLVANDVSSGGFAADDNAAVLIDDLAETPVALTGKRALADRIWYRVIELRKARRPSVVAAKR
jgi:phosphopantothenoylcysteine decarboxylase/phosphopantothenate--cysteine ligase